jgi:hypothetical protein
MGPAVLLAGIRDRISFWPDHTTDPLAFTGGQTDNAGTPPKHPGKKITI